MCSAPTSGRRPRRALLSRLSSLTYRLVPVRALVVPSTPSALLNAWRLEPSRLVLHLTTPSPLRDLILAPRLSPTLAHIVAHPPALLQHLASAQLLPPPPASRPDRFWHVFSPLSSRAWEVEEIVLGPKGGGPRHDGEMVIEVVTRAPGVERDLLGWLRDTPCLLSDLDSLKSILEDVGKTPSEVCGQPD